MNNKDVGRLWSKVSKTSNNSESCWLWQGYIDSKGYGRLQVNKVAKLAHRLVYKQVHGILPPVVRHVCDNPRCVRPSHLVGGYTSRQYKRQG